MSVNARPEAPQWLEFAEYVCVKHQRIVDSAKFPSGMRMLTLSQLSEATSVFFQGDMDMFVVGICGGSIGECSDIEYKTRRSKPVQTAAVHSSINPANQTLRLSDFSTQSSTSATVPVLHGRGTAGAVLHSRWKHSCQHRKGG